MTNDESGLEKSTQEARNLLAKGGTFPKEEMVQIIENLRPHDSKEARDLMGIFQIKYMSFYGEYKSPGELVETRGKYTKFFE